MASIKEPFYIATYIILVLQDFGPGGGVRGSLFPPPPRHVIISVPAMYDVAK